MSDRLEPYDIVDAMQRNFSSGNMPPANELWAAAHNVIQIIDDRHQEAKPLTVERICAMIYKALSKADSKTALISSCEDAAISINAALPPDQSARIAELEFDQSRLIKEIEDYITRDKARKLCTIRSIRGKMSKTWNKNTPNWVLLTNFFGLGAGSAYKMCEILGIDPDGKTA